jgi:hypothetical protein
MVGTLSEGMDGNGSAFAPRGTTTYSTQTGVTINAGAANINVGEANANIGIQTATNIQVQAVNANVGIQTSATGINNTLNTGSGEAVTHIPSHFAIRCFIKT